MKSFRRKVGQMLFTVILLCAVILAVGRAVFAQEQTTPPSVPILITSTDNGVRTDFYSGGVLDFGVLFLVSFVDGVDVLVNVPDGQGGWITNGSVTLRSGEKSFPATYAGPAGFITTLQQVNIPIPRDEFPFGATVYLRVCKQEQGIERCRNSEGAFIKR